MPREPTSAWFFSVVVVRRGDRFLLVHERKHAGWYLPAGRVEPGETFFDAAVRETLEESGVAVKLDGIVRVEHSPTVGGGMRCRALFVATPVDDRPPRAEPNAESLEHRTGWRTEDFEAFGRIARRDDDECWRHFRRSNAARRPKAEENRREPTCSVL